ncbi:non-hydrolyzing UDP-N-acetylglucosamine 2-epimerase [Zeaxanthinibacter enoshimensis]|nr:UDP-N-acetylglucosamine 2-epimerase (non-hydrolyzing) [Zeaxanthinibacter enoshimensis]
MSKKIVTVIGARPQFVKAAVVSRAINLHNKSLTKRDNWIEEKIIHTGQHFDNNMSEIFFKQMEIPKPDFNLEINSMSHGAMTGNMLMEIEKVLLLEKPDWVLVYGDTNSTIAGALAAKKLHIKVAHVEAGLRSFNMQMPEEVNRILTDRISDLLFCPTESAVQNLMDEGYASLSPKIVQCGDVMNDAAIYYKNLAVKPHGIDLDANLVLSTIHRQENTDNPKKLKNIFDGLAEISKINQVVLPLHPRTSKMLKEYGITPSKNIRIIEPVGYFEMIWLLMNSICVITDSGGLQKEAFFFDKPCITVREETEWTELIEHGVNFLVGSNKDLMIKTFNQILNGHIDFNLNLYGDGHTGKQIVQELISFE